VVRSLASSFELVLRKNKQPFWLDFGSEPASVMARAEGGLGLTYGYFRPARFVS
jgi:hypothetical protein